MKLKMTIDDALNYADEWTRGMTIHEHSQGWRVVCLLLAEEVRRLREMKTQCQFYTKDREEYRPLLEWMAKNTPYSNLNINEVLSCDESWFKDYSFPLTLPELLAMVKTMNRRLHDD